MIKVNAVENLAAAAAWDFRKAGYRSQPEGTNRVWCVSEGGLRYGVESFSCSRSRRTYYRVVNGHGEAEYGRYASVREATMKAVDFLR